VNPLRRLFAFNSSRYRLHQENEAFAATIPAGAMVLDAGAGDAPYRSLYNHTNYESADFEQVDKMYAQTTYVCDLKEIPVEDGRFDYVIFTQVMEHLPDPRQVLAELYRVLKPGGKLLYSAPLYYEEHEQPYDFYRYTQFAVRHLFAGAGFEIERLDWLEGYFGTVAYQMRGMARDLPLAPRDIAGGAVGYILLPAILLLKAGFAGCSILFHRLETRVKFKQGGYPKNYVAIISKTR
jgi:SAM-dependent methyltransferase